MKVAILGASRGLGKALVDLLINQSPPIEILAMARRPENLERLNPSQLKVAKADFSRFESQTEAIEVLSSFAPERIIYSAGGGPFGRFGEKAWKDHQWALEVSFLMPARLMHEVLKENSLLSSATQLIVVGSAVAENKADPFASSYAAAKHALRGLYSSIVEENRQSEPLRPDIRLFSPTYMDTDMLPPNAWPRQQGHQLLNPAQVAEALWGWAISGERNSYYQYQ